MTPARSDHKGSSAFCARGPLGPAMSTYPGEQRSAPASASQVSRSRLRSRSSSPLAKSRPLSGSNRRLSISRTPERLPSRRYGRRQHRRSSIATMISPTASRCLRGSSGQEEPNWLSIRGTLWQSRSSAPGAFDQGTPNRPNKGFPHNRKPIQSRIRRRVGRYLPAGASVHAGGRPARCRTLRGRDRRRGYCSRRLESDEAHFRLEHPTRISERFDRLRNAGRALRTALPPPEELRLRQAERSGRGRPNRWQSARIRTHASRRGCSRHRDAMRERRGRPT
ncbi:MAG: hypothetical protein RIR33_3375 [Pseudomonadota bacterium]|jgi:hypothetical protein